MKFKALLSSDSGKGRKLHVVCPEFLDLVGTGGELVGDGWYHPHPKTQQIKSRLNILQRLIATRRVPASGRIA